MRGRVPGAGQFLLLAASFALAGLAISGWFAPGEASAHIVGWFVGAVVVHDLVLLPVYSLLDRRVLRGASRGRPAAWTPYVRVPALLSGLLLLVFAPFILGWGGSVYRQASGMTSDAFLGRWLTASGVMLAVGAAGYVVARLRARRL